jgi:LuxR family transcriptional regulator, maltose regulon positive regulatory protein
MLLTLRDSVRGLPLETYTSMTNKVDAQLIHEKIDVPNEVSRTSRPRLLDLLADNLAAYNATVIHGRAGTGKTTLAGDFARRTTRPVCWYKIDAGDTQLDIFCRYLIATLRLQRPSLDEKPLMEMTESTESDRAELLAEGFVFQLGEARSEPLLVIIEDLHLVYDADWVVPFFHRLLPLLPADVHLIITCRSLPPTPLWRLRSKQMLRVIDEAELAFTLEETLRLFETYGLSEEHASIAFGITNGRAAAIANFAATPGLAGRAIADSFLSLNPRKINHLGQPTPDFQT